MPFSRPTPVAILQRIQAEIDIGLPGADARLRRSPENVLAKMLTGASHLLYGFLQWISQQIFISTCSPQNLLIKAAEFGLTPTDATAAAGPIQFTGVNTSVIPAGTVVQRGDSVQYTVDSDITIIGTTGNGTVTAVSVGADGNAVSATRLTLVNPISGVQSTGIIQAPGLTAGTDIETTDALRSRLLQYVQSPPQGGAKGDYEIWAKKVSGVTRVWPYPNQYGLGTVAVLFVMDNKVGTIIPSDDEVAEVQTYIDAFRPVTADVTVVAPIATPVNLEIHLNPNTVAVQNAVTAELQDFFAREGEPGVTLYLSRVNDAISTAAGEFDHVLVTPNANVASAFGHIPTLGAITFAGI